MIEGFSFNASGRMPGFRHSRWSFEGFYPSSPSATGSRCKSPNAFATTYLSHRWLGRLMPAHKNYHQTTIASLDSDTGAAGALDNLLYSKSRILRTKLEVLASEIQARFAMWDRNLERIDDGKGQVEALLNESSRLARYHLREPSEATRLRESSMQLDSQQRQEDIQCWRDTVQVMKDFLIAWEVHEQAKSRSIFINHAGAGTQESL